MAAVEQRLVLDDRFRARSRTTRDTTTFGCASSMRVASSFAANPPKTTECTAPMRAHASIATSASGIIGM
jgi:hypothetical protein